MANRLVVARATSQKRDVSIIGGFRGDRTSLYFYYGEGGCISECTYQNSQNHPLKTVNLNV